MSDVPEEVPTEIPDSSSTKSKFDLKKLCDMLKKYKAHILVILIAILSYFVYKKKFAQSPDVE
mgnify:CR=1 FL=1